MMFMGMKISLHIVLNVDNDGDIFLEENYGCKSNNHVDNQYHLISTYVIDGILKIIYVNKKINVSYPFTKNT